MYMIREINIYILKSCLLVYHLLPSPSCVNFSVLIKKVKRCHQNESTDFGGSRLLKKKKHHEKYSTNLIKLNKQHVIKYKKNFCQRKDLSKNYQAPVVFASMYICM